MKHLIKLILEDYLDDFDDLDVLDDIDVDERSIKQKLDKLPNIVTLYRILVVNSEKDINTQAPGSHYSMDKENLIKNYNFIKGKNYYMLTVSAPKQMIDVKTTIENNMNFPMEKEITLKDNGKGSKITAVNKLQ